MSDARDKNPNTKNGKVVSDPEHKAIKKRTLWVLVYVLGFGLLTVFLHAATADGWPQKISYFTVEAAVWAACALAGGLLGFLFGFPRTPDTEGAGARANTNLEQISDWLTKGLLGIGLTQVNVVPQKLYEVSRFIATSTGGTPNAQVFAQVLIVFALTTGFLIGFLWSRLYLIIAFGIADRASMGDFIQQKLVEGLQKEQSIRAIQDKADTDALALVDHQLDPPSDMTPVKQKDLDAAVLAASRSTRAKIYSLTRTLRKDSWPNEKKVIGRTIAVFNALIASDQDNKYHANHGQLGFALKDQESPEWEEAEKALTEAIKRRGEKYDEGWLYYEFNRAICNIRIDEDESAEPFLASSKNVKKQIIDDLLAAAAMPNLKENMLGNAYPNENPVPAWLIANVVDDPALQLPK